MMKCIPLMSCFLLTTMITFRSCDAIPHNKHKHIKDMDIKEYKYNDTFIPVKEKYDRMDIADVFFGEELDAGEQQAHPSPDPDKPNPTKKCSTPRL